MFDSPDDFSFERKHSSGLGPRAVAQVHVFSVDPKASTIARLNLVLASRAYYNIDARTIASDGTISFSTETNRVRNKLIWNTEPSQKSR